MTIKQGKVWYLEGDEPGCGGTETISGRKPVRVSVERLPDSDAAVV